MDSYMAFNGSCFKVTWTIFKNHLLEVGLTQNQEIMALRTLTTVDLFYFNMCEDPHEFKFIEIAFGWVSSHVWFHTTLEGPGPHYMILEVSWDGLWTLICWALTISWSWLHPFFFFQMLIVQITQISTRSLDSHLKFLVLTRDFSFSTGYQITPFFGRANSQATCAEFVALRYKDEIVVCWLLISTTNMGSVWSTICKVILFLIKGRKKWNRWMTTSDALD